MLFYSQKIKNKQLNAWLILPMMFSPMSIILHAISLFSSLVKAVVFLYDALNEESYAQDEPYYQLNSPYVLLEFITVTYLVSFLISCVST